jgi:hypothetical protein
VTSSARRGLAPFANFTVIAYTASTLLASAAPVLAQGIDDGLRPAPDQSELPLEPDTKFDAVRWYDEWWTTSVNGIKDIPATFARDMEKTYSAMKGIFKDGVRVGNMLIIRGGPDTARIAKYHFEKMGIHYRDTIKMFPEHAVAAGGHFADAGRDIGKVASKNARHTADVASYEAKKIASDAHGTGEIMSDIAKWAGRNYVKAGKIAADDVRDDVLRTGRDVRDSVAWTGRNEEKAATDMARWMGDYANADLELTKRMASWTAQQIPDGWHDTVAMTTTAAKATARWTKSAAEWTGEATAGAAHGAEKDMRAMFRATGDAVKWVSESAGEVLEANDKFFRKATNDVAQATLGNIPGALKNEVAGTKHDAKWMWKKGYEDGLKAGFQSAGDNYFAGDVEGIAVGTFYSIGAVAQGVAFLLVLEPLDFTGHVGLGVTKTVGLGVGGLVGTSATAFAGLGTDVAIAAGGVTMTVGTAALMGVTDTAVAIGEGARIAGTAVVGGTATLGAAIGGGLLTAGAGALGVTRTVGATAGGGVATALVGGPGLALGEVGITGAGVARMAGTAIAGTALTAGALAYGGLRVTGDVAWGTVKMVGITTAVAAGEVLVPTFDAVVTAGRLSLIAGNAIVDNAIITPAMATWDILTALTLGGWELVRDPAYGTFHLVAGATGFSYRLVALAAAESLTAVGGTLYAVAKAPLSLVFYGGMWTIAAGGKLLDTVTAPFAFATQNHWKDERRPQLEELLGHQEDRVREEIGDRVTYIRVVFSGDDRGKVNFFSTEKNGKRFRFNRKVLSNCLVVYRSKDTQIELNSGLYDRKCLGR